MGRFLSVSAVALLSLVSFAFGCGGNSTSSTGGSGGSSTTGGSGGSGGQTMTGGGGSGGCMMVDDGNECTDEQCDGTSTPKKDGVACAEGVSTCKDGACRPFDVVGLRPQDCAMQTIDGTYPAPAENGDIVMSRLNFDKDGSLEWVWVGIAVGYMKCAPSDRVVYITQPLDVDVPMSPAMYEEIAVPKLLVEKGQDIGPVPGGFHIRMVRVHLKNPMPVSAGQHAFSAIDMHPEGCMAGCYAYPGMTANDPPVPVLSDEDFWCTLGASDNPPLSGCGAMNGPYPGIGTPFKFFFAGGVALP